ncbi:hypothetical protein JW960_26325 [candidate division KSB1 bacterium]|nr:hypothetical protein [candidate division KSB1 bacterium]
MHLSIHYYVLSLSDDSCKLFEGFRDALIMIENGDFPSVPIHVRQELSQMKNPLNRFYHQVDQAFAKYYNQDSLKLVLMGEKENLSIFKKVSAFGSAIIGTVDGNFNTTPISDLGRIVWPVVRNALSGDREAALRELDNAVNSGKIAMGLDEVWYYANSQPGCRTLIVEDDYHVKGRLIKTDEAFMILEDVDVTHVFDDVVDAIIEKVLEMDGHVIFVNDGFLKNFQHIALFNCE